MELFTKRRLLRPDDTIGDLFIGDTWQCYTLEPTVREVPGQLVERWKIQNQTAIPVGRYRVIITFSPHFQRPMPLLLGVPGFTAVRIHWGNTAKDTDGCTLVGQVEEIDEVEQSRAAFEALFPKLDTAIQGGDQVWLTVTNP